MAGVSQSSAFCQTCQRQRLFLKTKPNHVLHLVLSLVTLSIWLFFVWIPLTVIAAVKGARCSTCGRKAGQEPLPGAPIQVDVRELPPQP